MHAQDCAPTAADGISPRPPFPWLSPKNVWFFTAANIDLLGDRLDDFGAAARSVTREAIGTVGSEPAQNPGPVQEIVDQGVDRDHAAADLAPAAPMADRAVSSKSKKTLVGRGPACGRRNGFTYRAR